MWGALSDERKGLPFINAAGPRQLSHSWLRVPRESWPHFTVSVSRLPQPGGPGPRIYIPREQGDPIIPPGTGFPFFASYYSQGYGGGIRTGLQAAEISADSIYIEAEAYCRQPASRWHLASDPAETHDHIFVQCQDLCFLSFVDPPYW
jgi:hypothetical protein